MVLPNSNNFEMDSDWNVSCLISGSSYRQNMILCVVGYENLQFFRKRVGSAIDSSLMKCIINEKKE